MNDISKNMYAKMMSIFQLSYRGGLMPELEVDYPILSDYSRCETTDLLAIADTIGSLSNETLDNIKNTKQ